MRKKTETAVDQADSNHADNNEATENEQPAQMETGEVTIDGQADDTTEGTDEVSGVVDVDDAQPDNAEGGDAEGDTSEPQAEEVPEPVYAAPRPRIFGHVEMKTLYKEIDNDRYHELADEMTELVLKKSQLEDRKKAQNKVYTDQINDLDERIAKNAQLLDNGEEENTVRCVWMLDFTNDIAELVRTDNHNVIERRALSLTEKQQKMALDEDRHPDDQEGLFDEAEELPDAPELDDDASTVDALIREVRAELRENPHAINQISFSTAFCHCYAQVLTSTSDNQRPEYWPAKFAPEHLFRVPVIEMADQEEPYILVMNESQGGEDSEGGDDESAPEDANGEGETLAEEDLEPMSDEEKQRTLDKAAAGEWADESVEEVASDD